MTDTVFELLDQSSFRIGERSLFGHLCAPPFDGKYRYIIEGTSDERDRIVQHLFVHDFRNICPTDLPNGISITVTRPRSEFRQVNFAEIKKFNDQSVLVVTLNFNFADWHLPVSLQNFSDTYSHALRQHVEGSTHTHLDTSDVGVFISCHILVSPTTNYWSAYRKADAQVLATYRKCLEDIYKPPLPLNTVTPAQGEVESRTRWWIQHVMVPVLGSGAVAAIAAGLIALLK